MHSDLKFLWIGDQERMVGLAGRNDQIGADLVGAVTRDLKQSTDWQIELLDQSRRPVFRIRIVEESPI
jgi:hypothetical protein